MRGMLKGLGSVLMAAGVAVTVWFTAVVVRDQEYAHAALLLERNPGNVLYEARFGGAAIKRGFRLIGAAGGALVAIDGGILIVLGVLAARQRDLQRKLSVPE